MFQDVAVSLPSHSGGLPVSVEGSNLNVIQMPQMVYRLPADAAHSLTRRSLDQDPSSSQHIYTVVRRVTP